MGWWYLQVATWLHGLLPAPWNQDHLPLQETWLQATCIVRFRTSSRGQGLICLVPTPVGRARLHHENLFPMTAPLSHQEALPAQATGGDC